MALNLKVPPPAACLVPRIAVVGVGGAGGNAVEGMIDAGLEGIDFVVANCDAPALGRLRCERQVRLGRGVTRGLGAGARPEVGRAAAEETLAEVRAALDGLNMVFITAGMGGGTGTGASPVIARVARELGIVTVGVMTTPFAFEGPRRMRMAAAGLQALQPLVDTLLVIPNQNLFKVADRKTTLTEAFRMADDVMQSGVRAVTDLILRPGLVNLDFSDVRAVVAGMGRAMMGVGEAEGEAGGKAAGEAGGEAEGEDRAVRAAEAAISNPLLEGLPLDEVRALLVNVTGGADMTLHEAERAVSHIGQYLDPAAELIFGSAFDPSLTGRLRISVVATAQGPAALQAPPDAPGTAKLSLVSSREDTREDDESAAPGAAPDAPPETPGADTAPAQIPPAEAPPAEKAPAESPAPPRRESPSRSPDSAALIPRLMDRLSGRPDEVFRRAERLYHGHGVTRDRTLAFKLYRKAAKRGHAAARNRLGWMLERGEGTEADPSEAALWHRKAAEQGHLNAMNDLACLFRQGRGVLQDVGQALDWFRKAAAGDYAYAEFNLGRMYEQGCGVPRDPSEAARWYRRAAAHGHPLAEERLADLGATS